MMYRKSGLYIKQSGKKGRGIFCSEIIAAGEVIEITPAICFSAAEAVHIDKTELYNYYFSAESVPISMESGAGCLALGLLSLCNHADLPNAEIDKTIDDKTAIFTLKALSVIPPDTEISISYGQLWFEPE